MCKFFSVISNGKGSIKYFKPEDVVKIMSEGNPENYDFNSHSSFMHFLGIKGKQEDKWNKWEYDPDKKEIKVDSLVAKDDRKMVKEHLDEWFNEKNKNYLRHLYENYGVYRSNGVCRSNGVNESDGVNASNGVYRSNGVYWSNGVNESNGVCRSDGVYRSDGVNESYGVLNSCGVDKEIFSLNKKREPKIFGKKVSEKEFYDVMGKIDSLSGGWRPTFNNLKSLMLKTPGGWKVTLVANAEELSKKDAWGGMPKGLLEYIKSLPQFNAKVFEVITGIKV